MGRELEGLQQGLLLACLPVACAFLLAVDPYFLSLFAADLETRVLIPGG